jgi:hypothetical protein
MGHHMKWQTVGHTYRLDLGIAFENLIGFGLRERTWDGLRSTGLRGIGLIDAKHYDPSEWRANSLYWPYEDKDRFDAFWGAKLLMRFTPEQLTAVVDEAQFSDPRSRQYMLDTLIERQRKTARYWFEQVAPIDEVEIANDRLCFSDLLLKYKLRNPATHYSIDAFDRDGKRISEASVLGGAPRTCTTVQLTSAPDAYTIVRIRVRRNASEMPPVVVHVARNANGELRVIGLRRR